MTALARRSVVIAAAVTVSIAGPARMHAAPLAEPATWQDVLGRWDALRSRFPPQTENDSARQLRALSERLGISLVATPLSSRPQSDNPVYSPAYKLLRGYVNAALKAPGAIPEPAAALSDYFQHHRSDLDRLIAHLVEAPTPQWSSTVGQAEGPQPRFEDFLAMDALLAAEALWQEQRGAHAAAQRALEAHWRLDRAVADHPTSSARFDARFYATNLLRVLRLMDGLPTTWHERVDDFHPHRGLDEEVDLTTLEFMELARVEPEARLMLMAVANALALAARQTAVDLAGQPPCSVDPATLSERFNKRLGVLGATFPAVFPQITPIWDTADRLLVERELTRKVLDLKARRDAAGGAWPPAVPGIESSACTGAHWTYSVAPDGRMTLALSRAFGDQPPPSFTAAPRPLH